MQYDRKCLEVYERPLVKYCMNYSGECIGKIVKEINRLDEKEVTNEVHKLDMNLNLIN